MGTFNGRSNSMPYYNRTFIFGIFGIPYLYCTYYKRKGSALRHHIEIGKLRAHIPMANRLRVRTQQRYKAPSDPRVKNY